MNDGNPVYLGEWSDEEGMLHDFGITAEALEGAAVIVAVYDCPPYEGYAHVLFEKGGKLYEVDAVHCSCYGLAEQSPAGEGPSQWEPEEVAPAALLRRAERGHFGTRESSEIAAEAARRFLARDA
jgi:hypothetical protein